MRRYFIFFFILSVQLIFPQGREYIQNHYDKHEFSIVMRDGVKLFTAVYSPKDTLQDYPIIFLRTPYSIGPYGEENYPDDFVEAPEEMVRDGYIFVFQDVRGRFMSEGEFVDMRPYIPEKKTNKNVDESSDTYDTIDWLIKNIRHNNGKVGLWGISYPGFYSAMGAIDAHPALVAVSPEAPISDWFIGDDFHHNGAFSLMEFFNFFYVFGQKRDSLTTQWPEELKYDSPDAYNFFLDMGPLTNINLHYYHNKIPFWDSTLNHPDYDYFWKAKNNLPHFKNIKPAMLIVGGWYDSEDLYGPLHIYKSINEQSPGTIKTIVLGPWFHGGWIRSRGDSLGNISFGMNTSDFFREKIYIPFFEHFLKGKDNNYNPPGAYIFQTGSNKWKTYSSWPPPGVKEENLFFDKNQRLTFDKPVNTDNSYEEYLSDPMKPVPYTDEMRDSKLSYNKIYMVGDQRFAAERPDVIVFETEPLEENVTISGPMRAEIYMSISGTDADLIVKIIDVFPASTPDPSPNPKGLEMGGYQELLRGEIMRGRFRSSFERPEAFEPDKKTKVEFNLQDINHTFLKGHKIMVQVQSSWFPYFDRNPQTYVENIYKAEQKDFQKEYIRIYHSEEYPSSIHIKILKEK